jgi:hypothetical protein
MSKVVDYVVPKNKLLPQTVIFMWDDMYILNYEVLQIYRGGGSSFSSMGLLCTGDHVICLLVFLVQNAVALPAYFCCFASRSDTYLFCLLHILSLE